MASLASTYVFGTLSSRIVEEKNWHTECSLDVCPLEWSYWGYIPSLAANGLFLALFALSTILYLGQGMLSKRFISFSTAMACGCILEVLGYIGRLMARHNVFNEV
jgi:hypothetical protein